MKRKATIKGFVTAFNILGAVMVFIAYHGTGKTTPEWVYNLLSIGLFSCVLSGYLSVMVAYPKTFTWITSGVVLYCFGFDMISELTGLNKGSALKTIFWSIGLTTTIISHYGFSKSTDD